MFNSNHLASLSKHTALFLDVLEMIFYADEAIMRERRPGK